MTEHLAGSSQDVANNFLKSDFWEPGVQIAGVVRRNFRAPIVDVTELN